MKLTLNIIITANIILGILALLVPIALVVVVLKVLFSVWSSTVALNILLSILAYPVFYLISYKKSRELYKLGYSYEALKPFLLPIGSLTWIIVSIVLTMH